MQPVVNYDHKTIQVRRGSTTEWRRYGAICVPAEGEICVEFFQDADGSRNGNTGMKVGNGTSNYTDLPYLITNQNQDDRISDDQINNWDLTVEKLANLVASEVGQSNSALGDNVQEALDDLNSRLLAIDPDGGSIEINDISGLEDALNDKADQSALEKEIQDRKDGDQALQDQIDALDPDGDRNVDWDEIQNKPTEFPPEAHDQGWDTITGKPADFPPSAHDHAWSEITGKPSEFPPETHGHEIADVDGLQDALDAAGGTPAWDDVTGKPSEFPPEAHNQDWSTITNTPSEYPPEAHTHGQDEVDGLELRLEAIEGSISSGGGFVDAPNDGQLYGRQSEAWAVVPAGGASSWNDLTDKPADFPPSDHTHEIDDVNGLQDALDAAGGAPAWDDVTGKPSEFPPASHNHDGVYQPVGDYIGDAPNDGDEYARKNQGWVKLQDHNYTGADAVKLTGDQSVAGHKTWTGVATFGDTVTMRGTLNGDDTANFQNAVTAGSFVKTGGTSGEYLMADGSVSSGPTGGDGGGEFVHIGEAPPADPQEGQQWMEVPADGDATMWIYDSGNGGQWLQQPGGKDGAAGADGNIADATEQGVIATWDDSAKQWTPTSAVVVDGNSVGIGSSPESNLTISNPNTFAWYFNVTAGNTDIVNNSAFKISVDQSSSNPGSSYIDFKRGSGAQDGFLELGTNNASRLTIDANGKATFSGNIIRSGSNSGEMNLQIRGSSSDTATGLGIYGSGAVPCRIQYNKNFELGKSSDYSSSGFTPHLEIDISSGDATFSGSVSSQGLGVTKSGPAQVDLNDTSNATGKKYLRSNNGRFDIVSHDYSKAIFYLTDDGNAVFQYGTVTDSNGRLAGVRDLIETLHTLRNATKDEITLEGLRDAIGNAVGGLIEKFEAMQSTATQEIEA